MENIQSSSFTQNPAPAETSDAASLWGVFGFGAGLHKECPHTPPQTQLPPALPPSSTTGFESVVSKLSELCTLLTSAVQSLAALAKNIGTTTPVTPPVTTPPPAVTPGATLLKDFNPAAFADSIKKSLTPDKKGQVHEEQLQYGVLNYLMSLLGADKASAFKSAFESASKQDGKKVCEERAVRTALHQLVAKRVLTADQAALVNGMSFAAAQLDARKDRLYDNHGGKKDASVAVAPLAQAVTSASAALQSMQSGTIPVSPRAVK